MISSINKKLYLRRFSRELANVEIFQARVCLLIKILSTRRDFWMEINTPFLQSFSFIYFRFILLLHCCQLSELLSREPQGTPPAQSDEYLESTVKRKRSGESEQLNPSPPGKRFFTPSEEIDVST